MRLDEYEDRPLLPGVKLWGGYSREGAKVYPDEDTNYTVLMTMCVGDATVREVWKMRWEAAAPEWTFEWVEDGEGWELHTPNRWSEEALWPVRARVLEGIHEAQRSG